MSPSTPEPRRWPGWRAATVFAAGTLVLVGAWVFGYTRQAYIGDLPELFVAGPNGQAVFGNEFRAFVELAAAILVATAAYFACLWAAWRGFRYSFPAAIVASLLAFAAVVPAAPIASPDVVHFSADVRTLWLHGIYPGSAEGVPAQIDDPVAKRVIAYKDAPSGYGPVAYSLGGLALPFAGDGFVANVVAQKALAGLLLVFTAGMTGLLARSLGGNAAFASAALGLNPLMLTQFAGDGHNDVMLAALAVPAFLTLTARSWPERAPGVALGVLSFLAKFATGPAAALVLAMWFPRWRRLFALVFAAVMLVAVIASATDRSQAGAQGPLFAVWDTAWETGISLIAGESRDSDLVVACAFATFLVVGSLIVLEHRLESAGDLVAASGLLLGVFLFAGFAGYLPWYQVWYLPLALASGRRWLLAASLAFSVGGMFLLLVRIYEDRIVDSTPVNEPRDAAVLVVWAVTAALGLWFWRRDREANRVERAAAEAAATSASS